MTSEAYLSRGVSPTKEDVKAAISQQDPGLFPGAFCKIIPDPAGDPGWCAAFHADGAGTKSAVAYLMYRETGDCTWFEGIAQDSLVMNSDDLLAIGATGPFLISNTIGRNAHRIPGDIIVGIIAGYDKAISRLAEYGIKMLMTGGETADVGDLVRTVICDSTMMARLPRSEVVNIGAIKSGLDIIGLSSTGRAIYEEQENSGLSSNGLTAARHLLLHHVYAEKYPESYSETIADDKVYTGSYLLEDKLPGSSLSVGEALLSPTRSYLPPVKEMLEAHRDNIHGIIHCTGGGQVECIDFGKGIRYVKNNLFPMPALFQAILNTGQISEKEMYRVFNMGHRMEIYCNPTISADLMAIAAKYQIETRIIGRTEICAGDCNEVVIGSFSWRKNSG